MLSTPYGINYEQSFCDTKKGGRLAPLPVSMRSVEFPALYILMPNEVPRGV